MRLGNRDLSQFHSWDAADALAGAEMVGRMVRRKAGFPDSDRDWSCGFAVGSALSMWAVKGRESDEKKLYRWPTWIK
jgi:hypothetical protein